MRHGRAVLVGQVGAPPLRRARFVTGNIYGGLGFLPASIPRMLAAQRLGLWWRWMWRTSILGCAERLMK